MSSAVAASVALQCADGVTPPADAELGRWVGLTLSRVPGALPGDVALRLVSAEESQALNHRFRGRDSATNVLAFPAEPPPGLPPEAVSELGDLVICMPVLEREAAEQGKTLLAHFAHLVVHGTLHLAGFDHISDEDAAQMEGLEREILRELGFADPYHAEQL
jgi:probable rRNA maturation factor